MTPPLSGREQRVPSAVLAAAFLFNLGQGVLRPAMPLYLQRTFSANYRMVTLIPVVFGAGKWIANLPTGYLLNRLGRPLMVGGLTLIALIDVLSVVTSRFDVFLGLRALGGLGWAMFATVATTATVSVPAPQRRSRAVSLLLMSETSGLLLGSAAGGWLYEGIGVASPFLFEAACMVVASLTVLRWASLASATPSRQRSQNRRALSTVLRTPGVVLMGVTPEGSMTTPNGRVMFIAAHPDDPDFLAGGTVARLAKEGREVAYVILTNGNKGSGNRSVTSEQLAPIRAEEQRRAAQVLGVGYVEFLGYEDGELEDTRDLRRDVTREIRRWRPDLIITLNPHRTYNNFPGWHRDHRVTGRVVLDCVYPLARDHLAFPELPREYEPHSVREVHFIQWEQPRLVVDISETMELKLEAIRCHASQIGDFKDFEARMRNRAAILGKEKGYAYAEGFDQIVVPG